MGKLKMMKIQTPENMNDLLECHWKWFITTQCQKKDLIGDKYKCTGKSRDRIDLIKEEIDINARDIEDLITADYKIWRRYIRKLKDITADNEIKRVRLLHYFGYDSWIKNKNGWNAYKYMQGLGVRVCPYCNKNTLDYSIIGEKDLIPRTHFDHFFPKDIYPFLSCSLYNLIPCCYTCNSAKRNEITKIIYPYEEEFGEDGEFKLVPSVDKKKRIVYQNREFRDITADNSMVKLIPQEDSKLKERIKGADKIFHLSEIYSQQEHFIRDLIEKINAYPHKKNIIKSFKLKATGKKLFYWLFNLPIRENEVYPYQKITKDLLKQIGNLEDMSWLKQKLTEIYEIV
jgi:hypothetical protein